MSNSPICFRLAAPGICPQAYVSYKVLLLPTIGTPGGYIWASMGFPSSIRDPWETASSWTPHGGRRCLSQDGSILAGFFCFALGIPTVSAPLPSSCPLGFFCVPPRPPGLDLSIPSLDSSGHSHPQHYPFPTSNLTSPFIHPPLCCFHRLWPSSGT